MQVRVLEGAVLQPGARWRFSGEMHGGSLRVLRVFRGDFSERGLFLDPYFAHLYVSCICCVCNLCACQISVSVHV